MKEDRDSKQAVNNAATEARADSARAASSAASGLQQALAAREALLREIEGSGQEQPAPLSVESRPAQAPKSAVAIKRGESTVEASSVVKALRAQVDQLEAEREELNARLDNEGKKVQRLGKACTDREKRITALEVQLRKARDSARNREQHTSDTTDAKTQLAEMEDKYRELAASSERERRRHEEEVASLTKQISELRQRYETKISEMGNELQRQVDWPGNRDPRGQTAEPPPRAAVPQPSPDGSRILIVDNSQVGRELTHRLRKFGYPTLALDPNRDVDSQMADQQVVCAALNLALPTTWRTARLLRSSTTTAETPIIAYALAQPTEDAFWFGSVDCVLLPLKYADLPGTLGRMTATLKHVILIGLKNTLSTSVQQELADADISAEVVLDRRTALAAVRGKYPQVAVIYAASNPVDGFRTIAAIRGLAIFRDLPSVFLLDEEPVEREEEMLSSGVRTLLRLGSVKIEQLVDEIASAVNLAQAAAKNGK